MQKQYILSCCAECPAYKERRNGFPGCEKQGWRIEWDSGNSINPSMVGFPEWCPLETVTAQAEMNADYKKEIKRIMQIMEDDANPDALLEASHYLNAVVALAKKKAETD
jgi:hypothetical protein